MQLARFDSTAFLRDTWQREPLLIRNPWTAWCNPVEPDELAGLACEPGVEARLVEGDGAGRQVSQGPFAEDRFAGLGGGPWTLLVQAVDHHVPEVAALLRQFRFIPNWRTDDVMVSYASDGGGVGAHFDQYDVFLIQGLGRRRWQIGQRCDADTALVPHDHLRLLADFEPSAEWVLEPGDILYLPPGVAHDGVALGDDCMTYSVGFRAPAQAELVAHWTDHVLAGFGDDERYTDPGLAPPGNPGEIDAAALEKLHRLAIGRLLDRAAFARWFGGYTTEPKYPEVDWSPAEPADFAQLPGAVMIRNPASRFAFIEQDAGAVTLFVNGESLECGDDLAAFAKQLCASDTIEVPTALSPALANLIATLIDSGAIALDLDD